MKKILYGDTRGTIGWTMVDRGAWQADIPGSGTWRLTRITGAEGRESGWYLTGPGTDPDGVLMRGADGKRTRGAALDAAEAHIHARVALADSGRRPCPKCGMSVSGRSWSAHAATHRAGRRDWRATVPYWRWDYALADPEESGDLVWLTRSKYTKSSRSTYRVHIIPASGAPVTVRLDCDEQGRLDTKGAQAQAVQVYADFRRVQAHL